MRQRKRRFSTYVVQVVRLVCNWGLPRGYLASNPANQRGHVPLFHPVTR